MKYFSFIILFFLSISFYGQTAEEYIKSGKEKAHLCKSKSAIDDFKKAIELNPNDPVAYYEMAYSKMQLGDYKDAKDDFNKAIELNPKYHDAYYGRAWAKLDLKDTVGACLDWNKANYLGNEYAKYKISKYCKLLP